MVNIFRFFQPLENKESGILFDLSYNIQEGTPSEVLDKLNVYGVDNGTVVGKLENISAEWQERLAKDLFIVKWGTEAQESATDEQNEQ